MRRIFDLCAAGKGPNQIARILTQEQVLNPTNQYYQATGAACTNLDTTRPYTWSGRTVAKIRRTMGAVSSSGMISLESLSFFL